MSFWVFLTNQGQGKFIYSTQEKVDWQPQTVEDSLTAADLIQTTEGSPTAAALILDKSF